MSKSDWRAALPEQWHALERTRGRNALRMRRLRTGLLIFLLAELAALAAVRWRLPCCLAALALGAAAVLPVSRRVAALTEENNRLADEMDALADRMEAPKRYSAKSPLDRANGRYL